MTEKIWVQINLLVPKELFKTENKCACLYLLHQQSYYSVNNCFCFLFAAIIVRTCFTLPLQIYSVHNMRKFEKVHASIPMKAQQLISEIQSSSRMHKYRHWDNKDKDRLFKANVSGQCNATISSSLFFFWC